MDLKTHFQGLTFVFTGELDSTAREDAADLVKRYGGRVTTAPSKKTSYVIVGREAGEKKLEKVRELGIPTLDEDGFFALIENSGEKAPPAVSAAVPPVKKRPPKTLQKKPSVAPIQPVSSHKPALVKKRSDKVFAREEINDLWTVKYAPHTLNEIIGNKTNVDTLAKWLNGWKQNCHNDFKGSKGNFSTYRAALLSLQLTDVLHSCNINPRWNSIVNNVE